MDTDYTSEVEAELRLMLLDWERNDLLVADGIRKYCLDILEGRGIPNKDERSVIVVYRTPERSSE